MILGGLACTILPTKQGPPPHYLLFIYLFPPPPPPPPFHMSSFNFFPNPKDGSIYAQGENDHLEVRLGMSAEPHVILHNQPLMRF